MPRLRVPEDPPVEPFKKEEIELLIKACDFCEEAVTDRRRKFIMQRSTSKRDKAIVLTLLDTGLRASELCALRVEDVEMKSGKVSVRAGESGKAKAGRVELSSWVNRPDASFGAVWWTEKMGLTQTPRFSLASLIGPSTGIRCAN